MGKNGTGLPFISIVVSVRNGKHFAAACVESLLQQDYPKSRHEIIVVDNCSTDGVQDFLKRYDIRVLSAPLALGGGVGRNAGIRESKGDLIAITDIDCVAHPSWLHHLAEDWGNPRYGGFVGPIVGTQTGNPIQEWMEQFYNQELNLKNTDFPLVQTANAAYRRSLFEQIGGFDENLTWWEDVEFSWRMKARTAFEYKFKPGAIVYHQNRATLQQVRRKFYTRGYGKAACAKRIPFLRKPPIPLLAARHGANACLQAGKIALRTAASMNTDQREALLRTKFWFSFHWGMAAGLASGWFDAANANPNIPKILNSVSPQ